MKPWLLEHKKLLSKQILQQRLPHAVLFSGVSGSGKKELAHWLINTLACQRLEPDFNQHLDQDVEAQQIIEPCQQCKSCLLLSSQTYPDHLTLSGQHRSITVDEVRSGNQFFETTAQIGHYKSVLIEEAQKVTVSAANALLKTLEEPSADSIIILLTNEIDTLLPTIVSRCRVYAIQPPTGLALLQHLQISETEQYSNLTHLPELTDPLITEQFEHFTQTFLSYWHTREHRSQLLSLLIDNEHSLRWLEKLLVNMMRNTEGWLNDQNKLSSVDAITHNREQIWQVNQCFLACRKKIKSLVQVNPKFELEKFLIDIDQILMTE